MHGQLASELREFLARLESARDACERPEFLASYNAAITLTTSIVGQQDLQIGEFERLERIVSDALPWSDDLLETWHRIERLLRLAGRDGSRWVWEKAQVPGCHLLRPPPKVPIHSTPPRSW